ncbi:hypothetical protein C8J57DRAFT_1246808 [Mycena rebaudengoi]|nr:hypothetical protein C8J57DRAFT_1246808 [Mycena rebaudengoi]
MTSFWNELLPLERDPPMVRYYPWMRRRSMAPPPDQRQNDLADAGEAQQKDTVSKNKSKKGLMPSPPPLPRAPPAGATRTHAHDSDSAGEEDDRDEDDIRRPSGLCLRHCARSPCPPPCTTQSESTRPALLFPRGVLAMLLGRDARRVCWVGARRDSICEDAHACAGWGPGAWSTTRCDTVRGIDLGDTGVWYGAHLLKRDAQRSNPHAERRWPAGRASCHADGSYARVLADASCARSPHPALHQCSARATRGAWGAMERGVADGRIKRRLAAYARSGDVSYTRSPHPASDWLLMAHTAFSNGLIHYFEEQYDENITLSLPRIRKSFHGVPLDSAALNGFLFLTCARVASSSGKRNATTCHFRQLWLGLAQSYPTRFSFLPEPTLGLPTASTKFPYL